MLSRDPQPNDETDPSRLAHVTTPLSPRGIAYIIRKGHKYHNRLDSVKDIIGHQNSSDYKNIHRIEKFDTVGWGKKKKRSDTKRSDTIIMSLRSYEYFLSYDPYSFWSMIAAMSGVVSIVYPRTNVSREEWAKGYYIGAYLEDRKLPLRIPGIAYGWTKEEIEYARNTMHKLRTFLMKVKKWGEEVSVQCFVRDCERWHRGERTNFEGALLAEDLYFLNSSRQ